MMKLCTTTEHEPCLNKHIKMGNKSIGWKESGPFMSMLSEEELVPLIIRKVSSILDKEVHVGVHDELAEVGMNSFTTMRLIVELEVELDIEFDDEDLLMDKFDTIAKIAAMIAKNK